MNGTKNRARWLGFNTLVPLAGVAAVTLCYKVLVTGVNATTVALSFLLVVLLTATARGLGPAILASLAGMLCFNFFFLPPVGTFVVHDAQNWVALFVFLATGIIAGQLSSAVRRRAREAEHSREQVWKLYQLSRAIIITPDPEAAVSTVSRQVREIFEIPDCEVLVPNESRRLDESLARYASLHPAASAERLREVFEKGESRIDPGSDRTYAPLKVGVRVTGVLCLSAGSLEEATIEAISGLVALALERARFLKELSRTEALRQSDQLKSALLASVSHDLRTPLTSIRAAVDNLLETDLNWDTTALREFHSIIREEVTRLTHRVQNLLEMARIEAGELHPVREWGTIAEIMDAVLDRCSAEISNHRLKIDCPKSLLLVKVDSRLLASVLSNLLENAAQYSPTQSEITVRAAVHGATLRLSVEDQGPGIPAHELSHVFDKFYRGASRSVKGRDGTGMGLAIARGMIEAHGGQIWAESPSGKGTTFTLALPVETRAVVESLKPLGDQE